MDMRRAARLLFTSCINFISLVKGKYIMDIRKTARLLLLNPSNEILLMNIKSLDVIDPSAPIQEPFWVTIGGKIEEGEDLAQAAAREAFEETGHSNVIIGPPVWYGTVVLNWKGKETELQETFLVAHTDEHEVHRDGLTAEEQEVVQKYKWWSLAELKTTTDVVIPQDMGGLLDEIVSGKYPDCPINIDLSSPSDDANKVNTGNCSPRGGR